MCAQTTRSGSPSRAPTCVWTGSQAPAQVARQTGAPGLWDRQGTMQFDIKSPNEPHVRNKQY